MNRVPPLGLAAAALALAADQASKLWLVRGFGLAERQPYEVMPGFDLVLAWNRGVSFSFLTADGEGGRYMLVGGTLLATLLLLGWLARTGTLLTGLALGLLIGGAVGNLVDRVAYGAVVDFVSLHAGTFHWFIFNVADCAITVGVALLLVEWVWPPQRAEAGLRGSAPKTPRS